MLISLKTLLSTLSAIFRSRAALQLENLALPHQIGILLRSARKRPKLTPADRLLWVALSRIWRDWRSALAIVKPETAPGTESSRRNLCTGILSHKTVSSLAILLGQDDSGTSDSLVIS